MAKDKERSVNPAQQQRKLEKAKALKKGKAEQQARRNEKLARRNPERIQRQVDDLKALEASGDIKPREKTILEELEKDLRAVHKAREALGEKAPHFSNRPPRPQGADGGILGKRGHDGERKPYMHRDSGSDTDESVRRIPMPEDTPPPVPRDFRRNNRPIEANQVVQGDQHRVPPQPTYTAKTTYESAPQIRDLKKEAVSKFVPAAVRRKQDAIKGASGKLLEPEEMDRLEAEGYLKSGIDNREEAAARGSVTGRDTVQGEDEAKRLAEEEARFMKEVVEANQAEDEADREEVDERVDDFEKGVAAPRRTVMIEEVEDEDA